MSLKYSQNFEGNSRLFSFCVHLFYRTKFVWKKNDCIHFCFVYRSFSVIKKNIFYVHRDLENSNLCFQAKYNDELISHICERKKCIFWPFLAAIMWRTVTHFCNQFYIVNKNSNWFSLTSNFPPIHVHVIKHRIGFKINGKY